MLVACVLFVCLFLFAEKLFTFAINFMILYIVMWPPQTRKHFGTNEKIAFLVSVHLLILCTKHFFLIFIIFYIESLISFDI